MKRWLIALLLAPSPAAVADSSPPQAGSGGLVAGCFEPPAHAPKPEELTTLRALIERTPDGSSDLPDLLLRLGVDEVASYQALHAAALAHGSAGQPEPAQEQQAIAVGKGAVRTLMRLSTDRAFASYPRSDEALALVAGLLVEMGRGDLARPVYKRLLVEFPRSPRGAEAYVHFGDFYLEHHDPSNALKFYDKVLAAWPDSRCAAYVRPRAERARAPSVH